MADFTPGQRGWIAYLDAYPLEVEFVGYDDDDPDWPAKPTAYWRALGAVPDILYRRIVPGRIVTTTEREDDETVLHTTREGAVREALVEAEYGAEREARRRNEPAERAERLRAELAALAADVGGESG